MKNFVKHPTIQNLQIKNDGSEFLYYGEQLEIIDHEARPGNIIKTVSIDGTRKSVNKLILETFGPEKPGEGRYYALCKDGNIENIHPKNLYWSRTHSGDTNKSLEAKSKTSKLNPEQTEYIYKANVIGGMSKAKLASIFNTSPTSIARAVKRYEEHLKTKQ
jgi:hypothetical protein